MALIPITRTMREIQDRTKGRVVLELLDKNRWIARAFEDQNFAQKRVIDRLQKMDVNSVGLTTYVEMIEQEKNKQLNFGTGKTAEEAVNTLADKVL